MTDHSVADSELPKVVCTEEKCEFYSENGCTAKEINLAAGYIHISWEGFRHVWTCRTFTAKPSLLAQNMFNQAKGYVDDAFAPDLWRLACNTAFQIEMEERG